LSQAPTTGWNLRTPSAYFEFELVPSFEDD
jgi:hypothetical protein